MEHFESLRSKTAHSAAKVSKSGGHGPVKAKIASGRYVVITVVVLLCCALAALIAWGIWRLCNKKKRYSKPNPRPLIPFKFPLSSQVVRPVQPRAGDSIFSDVIRQVRPSPDPRAAKRKSSLLPTLSGPKLSTMTEVPTRQRRGSVPVIPSRALSPSDSRAMNINLRRLSAAISDPRSSLSSVDPELSDFDERIDELEDAARRASVSSSRRRSSITDPGVLNPDLYGFGPESAVNAHGLGKLCFSLSYNAEFEVLEVRVDRATYLSASKRAHESSHYYVEVSLQPTPEGSESRKEKTNVVTSVRNPEFNTKFNFNCTQNDLNTKTVEFLIKEKKRQKDIVKGSVRLPLQDIQSRLDDPNLDSIWRDIVNDNFTDRSAGQIFLSLCHHPKKAQLVIGVLKCRDLTITEQESALLCRVTLMSADKPLKSEKSKQVKKDLDCPLINEVFTFALTQSMLNNVCMSVTVWSRRSLHSFRLYGKTIIGPMTYCDGEGYAHWNTMMQDPDKTVHSWHTLKKS